MLHSRLLRYIDEVARTGSIRRAALELNVAPSAINRRLIQLETELGGQLFERVPRGLQLTELGEVVLRHVRETLRQHERMFITIEELRGLATGEVRLVTMTGFADSVLSEALRRFCAAHPKIKLSIRMGNGEEICRSLLAHESDLGLGYNLPTRPRLTRFLEFDFQVGAVMSDSHPLSREPSLGPNDFSGYPLVLADSSMSLRQVIDASMGEKISSDIVMETDSIYLMKRMARESPYISFMNYADVSMDLISGNLVFIPVRAKANWQTIALVHRASLVPAPAIMALGREIERAFGARVGREGINMKSMLHESR